MTGKLAEQTYKGAKFWGFEKDQAPLSADKVEGVFKPKKKTIRFKREFSGHTFTDAEIQKLLDGETISFEAKKKDGSGTYTAIGYLKEQKYGGTKYWGFCLDFGKK